MKPAPSQQAHRGYLIRWSFLTVTKDSDRVWVEKDGHLICWANTVEQAKASIDLLFADPVAVCAWCPDAKERMAAATAAGQIVTHGCCKACSEAVVRS